MNWYVRQGLKPMGPHTEDEIRSRLLSGELSPEDLVWRDDAAQWKPAMAWAEFRALSVPARQGVGTASADSKEWVVLRVIQGVPTTFGPSSEAELREALERGEISRTDHVWKRGMTGWARIESRAEFNGEGPGNLSPL